MLLPVAQVLIEEIDPKQPEEVAKAAGQKRKADAAAMETAPAKKPAVQVGKHCLTVIRRLRLSSCRFAVTT